ncbi:hypothetical protein ACFL59_00825 [Planctomycetota bacterium]
MTPDSALVGTLVLHASLGPTLTLMWPKYRRGMVPVTLLAVALNFYLAWFMPGGLAVVFSMAIAGAVVRASDLSRSVPLEASRKSFVLTLYFLARHPRDPTRPRVGLAPVWRVARGVVLLAAFAGLNALAIATEPWKICPYLHDLILAVQLGLGYLGSVDVISPLARRLGLTELLLVFEGVGPGFAWSRSLRSFWGDEWNRPVSGMLRRGVFEAAGGSRRIALSLLAVFLASGLMHGPQLAFAADGAQRAAWIWLAILGTCWFVAHGVGCLLEGVYNRRICRPWVGRVFFYATFLLTIPCYPAPLAIALGVHGRTVDEATPVVLLRWAGVL